MVYVMSDIHGNMRRLDSILKQIDLQPDDILYILGDVIDRYPDGIRILKRIMKMPNVKMLLGNHEYMMLRALGRPYDKCESIDDFEMKEEIRHWYQNGGQVTHQYWKRIRKDMREEIICYLHTVPLEFDIEVNGNKYKLVHGAPADEYKYFKYRYPDETCFCVWKRWRINEEHHSNYTMIFGHTPTVEYEYNTPLKIWYEKNKIGIDCGCAYPEITNRFHGKFGRLACLRLDDMKEFYSE